MPPQAPLGQPGPPYAPYPQKKKTSPVVWILLGLGVFFVLAILAVMGAGFFFVHKIKQAGLDPELMKRNPGYATVKMMAAMNPDIEVVSMDDDKGTVTVREKKTGKTYSVNFDDAKKGRFTIKEDGKETVSITTTGDSNNGALEIKSSDGTMKIGGGADAKVPTWMPDYPGSTTQGAFSAQGKDGNAGSYTFKTKDSPDKVAKFYEDGFKSQGMKTSSTVSNSDGKVSGGMVSGEHEGKSAMVLLGSDSGETSVTVTYKSGGK